MFLADVSPYALSPGDKAAYLVPRMTELVAHHDQHCTAYASLVGDWRRHRQGEVSSVEALPFLPVTAFKEYALRSADSAVSVRSSSTTGQQPSQVYMDKPTRARASLSARAVLADFIGDAEATVSGVRCRRECPWWCAQRPRRGGAEPGALRRDVPFRHAQ